jgi:dipeptidyl aminopeptidase/acylaminoacyl peptidase
VTSPDQAAGEVGHLWPRFLPDGERFLYTVASSHPATRGIYLASLSQPKGRRVNDAWSAGLYAPEGLLIYASDDLLVAQPFDPDGARTVGDARVVADDATSARWGYFSVAPGLLAYFSAPHRSRLVWMDRAGREAGSVGPDARIGGPVLAPGGRHVAAHVADAGSGNDDIWVFDVATGRGVRLTRGTQSESDAVWSPDGRSVAFARDGLAIHRRSAGGGGEDLVLFESGGGEIYPNDWSPDGRWIAYSDFSTSWADLHLLPVGGSGTPIPLRRTPFSEHQARFSPDGQWIAYASDESGRAEVYLQALPPSSERLPVSTLGGSQPMWRGDGRELFYLALDGALMAVDVDLTSSPPALGAPVELFRMPADGSSFLAVRNHYAVTADGQRFLVAKPLSEASWEFNLVFNWVRGALEPETR